MKIPTYFFLSALFALVGLFACHTYSGSPEQVNKISVEKVMNAFPWAQQCSSGKNNETEVWVPNDPPGKRFFPKIRYAVVTIPCTGLHVGVIFEPSGKSHIRAQLYVARRLEAEAARRNVPNRVDLPTDYLENAAEGIQLFNRLLESEDFHLSFGNVSEYAEELLAVLQYHRKIVDDSLSYIHYLPPDFHDKTGALFLDDEPRWKRVVEKVKPMTVRFEDGLYRIHFFSYGGDIKEWKITARPDGTVVGYDLQYPYGVYYDLEGEPEP